MFLSNWYKVIAACSAVDGTNIKYQTVEGDDKVLKAGANSGTLQIGSDMNSSNTPSIYRLRNSYTSSGGVVLGTGTTKPAFNDYSLSGDLITTYTFTASVTKAAVEDGTELTALYTITNTGTEAFTVGEIALISGLYNNTTDVHKGMLERTVLDTPVTIPAGGIGQVTYTIRMNYPTA